MKPASNQIHNGLIFLLVIIFLLLMRPGIGFQSFLSTGDHGRDLYAFTQTAQGEVPYQDYWWCYGPLMPYYYALFIKFLGASIMTVQAGKLFLILCAAVFFYLTLSNITPPIFAFLGSIWFMLHTQDFFFTFNHIGGVTMITATTYFLFRYLIHHEMRDHWLAILCIFILGLIKLNFGLASLLCYSISIFLIIKIKNVTLAGHSRNLMIGSILAVPFLTAIVYIFFLNGLPLYEVRQCMPYLSSDHPHNAPLWYPLITLINKIFQNIFSSLANVFFAIIINLSLLQTILIYRHPKTSLSHKNNILLCLIILPLFYVVNMHEYILSGVHYRMFWSSIFSMYLIFILIAFATEKLSSIVRICLYAALFIVILVKTSGSAQRIQSLKIPERFIPLERAQVYVSNDRNWINPLLETTSFLEDNLSRSEQFLALPYDPLLYFLLERKSPTRQLIFFDHINIPEEQERSIIREIETNKVNWVVIANRAYTLEYGMGVFGETHCKLLADYIEENFKEVNRFGVWDQQPGWAWNYGTRILKRKAPLPHPF